MLEAGSEPVPEIAVRDKRATAAYGWSPLAMIREHGAVSEQVARAQCPVFLVINKVDELADKSLLLPFIEQARARFDAYVDCSPSAHGSWDYLGGMLVCQEAGASVAEASGRELVTLGWTDRRVPVAAATPELLAEAVAIFPETIIARDGMTIEVPFVE